MDLDKNGPIKVFVVFGTRPEAIKLAPLVNLLQNSNRFQVQVCTTGQHREMLFSVLSLFNIKPDVELDVMTHDQSLADVLSAMIAGLDKAINNWKPDVVVVQGDTATTLAGAMAAFYRGVKIAYIEAGLRTGKLNSPFPEEANRKMVSCISNWQFAPTKLAKDVLLAEGYLSEDIFVVGNTSIDAIKQASKTVTHSTFEVPEHLLFLEESKRMVLITGHRRENFGPVMDSIFKGFRILAEENPDIEFVYPVHLNPNVRTQVFGLLDGLQNFHLLDPQPYDSFVWLMQKSFLIITDSGGIQEEAPSLNVPVVVTRNDTERMEAVHSGACILAGTNPETINSTVSRLLEDLEFYNEVASAKNPFGDGTTSEKIVNILIDKF